MAEWNERLSTSLRQSQTFRLFTVAVLVLLLLIPISMIRGLVTERKERQASAIDEVTSKWGRIQHIIGPFLVVPYTYDVVEPQQNGGPIVRRIERHAVFLADSLKTRATIATETRSRGIYSVPVYKMDLVATGTFSRPDFSVLGVAPSSVDWERVQLVLGISDTRAIQERSSVTWNGAQVPMIPGSGPYLATQPGIHAMVGFTQNAPQVSFSLRLALNGSQGAYFVPFGESSVVELKSNYPHPSFQGNWLPASRSVSKDGFEAAWSIPFLGRSFPQAWAEGDRAALADVAADSRFGVEFVDPVDHYSMAERSVKYAGLFILLTFATLWLFEVRAAARVHPIQFLMLGGALCLFYLLLLSLSEHIPFIGAYALASIAVIAMVASYGVIVLGQLSRALAIGAVVAMLYGYLYVLLVNEDYALLIGSIGLFLILGVIMYATRKVDWYSVGGKTST
jgi:inner membrane protein